MFEHCTSRWDQKHVITAPAVMMCTSVKEVHCTQTAPYIVTHYIVIPTYSVHVHVYKYSRDTESSCSVSWNSYATVIIMLCTCPCRLYLRLSYSRACLHNCRHESHAIRLPVQVLVSLLSSQLRCLPPSCWAVTWSMYVYLLACKRFKIFVRARKNW